MRGFFVFALLWWLIGNPIIALLILLAVLYFLDRRFIGLLPSISKPFKQSRKINQLKQELKLQSHNTSSKLELANLLLQKKRYEEALAYLEPILHQMEDSAEVHFGLGLAYLQIGQSERGEQHMLTSLELNPRVRYGEPYLHLGKAFADKAPDKALHYLEQFQDVHTSSCEAYYRLGKLYMEMGRQQEAKQAFAEALDIYRGLPKYKKKSERRWALLSKLAGN
ncbi:tetratricopeptide repeat protein [Paenibacillus senegalensis]|uniref:tetratricopeptide repeat protein n=1 Tax=Paenibacillus senegalensis TaxID=1465766 RepID=UPI000288272F|nr:tetratricopeptide repeat protein [Paenibacillus senegalensis]